MSGSWKTLSSGRFSCAAVTALPGESLSRRAHPIRSAERDPYEEGEFPAAKERPSGTWKRISSLKPCNPSRGIRRAPPRCWESAFARFAISSTNIRWRNVVNGTCLACYLLRERGWIAMELFDRTINKLSDLADFRAQRHKVIVSNVSNIDVAGYEAKN